jgi:hypothetical protein
MTVLATTNETEAANALRAVADLRGRADSGFHDRVVDASPTLLKALLTQRHLQRYETFCGAYEQVAAQLAPESPAPSRAQFSRWLNGQLKRGAPHPDACRVLEGMFPSWTADDLFGPPPANGWQRRGERASTATDGLLESVPPPVLPERAVRDWLAGSAAELLAYLVDRADRCGYALDPAIKRASECLAELPRAAGQC